jgi:hypothetical protein
MKIVIEMTQEELNNIRDILERPLHISDQNVHTTQGLINWIKENVPAKESPERAAIWFVCAQDAKGMLDGTARELARHIFGGIDPYTIENVDIWLDTYGNEKDEEIIALLKEHFNMV